MKQCTWERAVRFAALFMVTAALLLTPVFISYSDVTGEQRERIDDIVQDILQEQGIDREENIDPDRVSDRNLEQLGEAVMSIMHPDPEQHEFMERMMGGEGSDRLGYMHRTMGYRYLANLSGRGDWGGMMGPGMTGDWGGMMGPGMTGGFPMMAPQTGAGPGLYLRMRSELDLTDSQIRRLREYREALFDSTDTIPRRLSRAQSEMSDLLGEENIDLRQVEEQVREIESLRADLRLAYIKAEVRAWETLNERQRETVRSWTWRGPGRNTSGPGRRGHGMMEGGMMGY